MSTYKCYEECIPHENRWMLNEKIDFNHGGVDLHLGELGGVLENWKDIAPVLELDSIAIGDIKADHPLSQGEQRKACLRKWKSRKGFMATYGKLLDACLWTNNLKCAEKIVMLLGATRPPSLNAQPQPTHPQDADAGRGPQVNQPAGATGNHGNTPPPKSTPAHGLITDTQQFSQMYPKLSYRDAFNKVLPDMKKSIVGLVDGLCDKAISQNLLAHEEKAGILVDNNEHKQASRFLDSLAPKIEVDPEVLALLMNMLTGLHSRTCDQIVCVLADQLKGEKELHEIDGKTMPSKNAERSREVENLQEGLSVHPVQGRQIFRAFSDIDV